MKKISSLLIIISVLVSICSCTFNQNVDERLIEMSNGILGTFTLEEGRTFSVVVDEENVYHVDINGNEKLVKIENRENKDEENTKSNISECDSEVMEIVESSKKKVVDYINNSDILNDKEVLVESINQIPVKLANFANDEVAEYNSEAEVIFINSTKLEEVCEWYIMHELVYALHEQTNCGKSRYQNTLFNEVLTDVITAEMEPEIIFEMESKYFSYYLWMYWYLGCVDFDGIEAYFYGYDNILERIPEAELNVFVESLEHENESEDAIIILTNCINDWGLENI